MDAQEALAAGILAGLKAQASSGSTTAEAVFGTLENDVVDQAPRNATIPQGAQL